MKKVAAIMSVLLLPVILESCGEMFEHCKDPGKFSVTGFRIRAVKSNERVYVAAPASDKPQGYLFIVNYDAQSAMVRRMTMGVYADCAEAESIETATEFSIISDHDLVTPDSTFVAGSDIQSVFSFEFALTDSFTGQKFFSHDYKFSPEFTVTAAQKHTLTFHITLNDNRKFTPTLPEYEFLPN